MQICWHIFISLLVAQTRIPELQMPWLLVLPGHQQPWLWHECEISIFLTSLRGNFNNSQVMMWNTKIFSCFHCKIQHDQKNLNALNSTSFQLVAWPQTYNKDFHWHMWVMSRRRSCLVTWFCYQMIAKRVNKTATPSWPDPYDPLDLLFFLMLYVMLYDTKLYYIESQKSITLITQGEKHIAYLKESIYQCSECISKKSMKYDINSMNHTLMILKPEKFYCIFICFI